MSSIAQDIRSGLRGIKGAGDAVRGKILEAGDEILDPKGSTHPDIAAAQAKNRAITEQGAAKAREAQKDIGARHGASAASDTQTGTADVGATKDLDATTTTAGVGETNDATATTTTTTTTSETTQGTTL